jgi:putative ABC transport system permease protein
MTILNDIRYGFRMLLKSPGFTLVAIAVLGLGIGVNSMMFTIYNSAMFKSLPFERPREIVYIYHHNLPAGSNQIGIAYDDFSEYRKQGQSLSGIAAFDEGEFNFSDQQKLPERLTGTRMSANLFSLIGQKVFLGRDFTDADERAGADPVAVLSYSLWQTRYAGDRSILGKGVRINGDYHTVIGIMPQDMEFPSLSRFWIPVITTAAELQSRSPQFDLVGRLQSGGTAAAAETELKGIAARIAKVHPETNKNIGPRVRPFVDWLFDESDQQVLKALVGAVGFVLLIACANVANLLLSRAVRRSRETSVRLAIGAGRWRIIRQLLVESVILSFIGGLAGLIFAKVGLQWFAVAVAPMGIPYWVNWSMDATAFVYLFAVCFVTGILFGLAPALQISKTDVNDGLKETGRSNSGSRRSRRLSSAFVIGEISLTIVLMVGAGLMVRSLMIRAAINAGVNFENVLTMQLSLTNDKYPEASSWNTFAERLAERLRALPDLESVTMASHLPAGGAFSMALKLADRNIADGNGKPPTVAAVVTAPGYFRALGLTVKRGRDFTAVDGQAGAEAAIVNERFAAEYWPGQDPLGKRIQLDGKGPWINVIGLSPPIRQRNLRQQQIEPMVYVPFRQMPRANFKVIMRTRSPEEAVSRLLRDEVQKLDPDLPLFNIMTLKQFRDDQNREWRILTLMFSGFAVIGLLLSVVGIYSVTAYATSQRTQEIGVRMALGARSQEIVWLVLSLGLKQLAIGLPLGIAAAFLTSRALSGILFQIATTDFITFFAIPALLTAVVIAACLLPAFRAAKLNPVEALRID